MNVGLGPTQLPEGITPIEAMQDFTKRASAHIDQAARAHADAVRATVSAQQKAMLQNSLAYIKTMQRRAR